MVTKLNNWLAGFFKVRMNKRVENCSVNFEKELLDLLIKYKILKKENDLAVQELEIKCKVGELPIIKLLGIYMENKGE